MALLVVSNSRSIAALQGINFLLVKDNANSLAFGGKHV